MAGSSSWRRSPASELSQRGECFIDLRPWMQPGHRMRQIQDLSLGFRNLHDGSSRCRQRSTTHRREQRDPDLRHRLPQSTRLSLCPGRTHSIDGSAERRRPIQSRLSRRFEICERRHYRRRRSGERWPLGTDSRVWLCVDADRGCRRLGAVQCWPMVLAGSRGLDLDQQRSLELGHVSLWPLDALSFALVLGSSAPQNTRSKYAPAVVEFVRVRDHIGWFPLHPRDRFIPWWERRDRRPVTQNITYVNRTYVTVVNQNNFISARPVNKYLVRDTTIVRQVSSARMTESLPIPNRTSLRIVSETGVRHGQRPSALCSLVPQWCDRTLSPAAYVSAKIFGNRKEPGPAHRAIYRHKAQIPDESQRDIRHSLSSSSRRQPNAKAFAPRNPGANFGPAPQAVAPAHGQKLATREDPIELKTKTPERPEHVQKPPAQPPQPASSAPEPSMGTVKRLELPPERTRQQLEIQKSGHDRQALEQQQKLQRRQQEQQKSQEHQAQIHQQQQEQQRLQQLRQQQQVEQQGRELQRQQEQLRAQQLRQKQLQEHQARESQKQEQAQPPQQKAVEHKTPVAPPQQDLRRLAPQRQQQPEGPKAKGFQVNRDRDSVREQ